MAEALPKTPAARTHLQFHALQVKEVISETADAISIAFEVPTELQDEFAYRAGQFVTLRLRVDGEEQFRSYSMSSSPDIDQDLQLTVKRVGEGKVSNWLYDNVREGASIEVSPPSGLFVLSDEGVETDVVAFAAGSGITPIFSIIKFVLASTARRVRMLYANRDRSSVIFHRSLQTLEAEYPDRLQIEYSLDEDSGFVDGSHVARLLGTGLNSEFFVCGPKGFMEMVTTTLVWCGARTHQLHIEKFTPDDVAPDADPSEGALVTMTLGRQTVTIEHRGQWTLIQAARSAGLSTPSSCLLGMCGTCVARITEGATEMRNNQVLTREEVAQGWVLTCQAKPVTPRVSVVYEELL